MPSTKVKYGFGFDPGINEAAWAIVGTDGSVTLRLIRNKFKKGNKVKLDNWAKLEIVLGEIQEILGDALKHFPKLESWTCEAQYCTRIGDPAHMVRLGWISSMAYTMGAGKAKRIIAVPATWTRNKPKELRHPELLEGLQDEEKWTWVGPQAPKSLMHNCYDSVGLALWGLAQTLEKQNV